MTASRRSRRGRPVAKRAGGISPRSIFGNDLELWLRSDRGIVTVSGVVSQWRDQSGKGRHFSQGTAANRPTFNATDANWGKPSLTFDGTTDYLTSDDAASVWAFLHNGTGGGCLAVLRHRATAVNVRVANTNFTSSAVGFALIRLATGVCEYNTGNGSVRNVNASTSPSTMGNEVNAVLFGAYEDGRPSNEAVVAVDFTESTVNDTAAPSAAAPTSTLRIGATSGATNLLDAEVLEFIAFSCYPTAAQLTALDNYMGSRYGL